MIESPPLDSHVQRSIDLRHVTFLIPVRIEHEDRERNLNLSIDYLNHHFQTNIIVGEESNHPQLNYLSTKCQYCHYPTNDVHTHRTRVLNQMAKIAQTPIIAIWDTDALIAPNQILATCDAVTKNGLALVYPYNGVFLELSQSSHRQVIECKYRLEQLSPSLLRLHHGNSLGGAIFFNRDIFIKAGMMNENFKSYGWEDNELIERFFKLGYPIGRTQGAFIHLQHYRGENSLMNNSFTKYNKQELTRIKKMNYQEIVEYINTFLWLND